MSRPRRAISIRQPAAELVLRGIKRFENRTLPTNIRERVYIYASLKKDDPWPYAWRRLGRSPGSLPTGVIVGTVDIVDCRWWPKKKWWAYKLANPRRVRPYLVPRNQPQPKFWIPRFR